jgi:hypothetical protein
MWSKVQYSTCPNIPTNDRAPPAFSAIHAKQYQLTFKLSITQDSQTLVDPSGSHIQCLKTSRQQAATRLCSTRSAPRSHHLQTNQEANLLPLQRNIPTRGLKPAYYLLGVGLVMAYGWRKIFIGNREKKYAPPLPGLNSPGSRSLAQTPPTSSPAISTLL